MVFIKDYLECARRFVHRQCTAPRAWLEGTPFEGCGCWEWEDSIYDAPQILQKKGLFYLEELDKYLKETESCMQEVFPDWDINNPDVVEPLFAGCLSYAGITSEQCFSPRGSREIQKARKYAMALFFLLSRATLKEVATIFKRSLATVTSSIYSVVSEEYWNGLEEDLSIVWSWFDYETSCGSYYDKHADELEIPYEVPADIEEEWADFRRRCDKGEEMDPYTCGFCKLRGLPVLDRGPRSKWNNELCCVVAGDWVRPFWRCIEFEHISE